MHNSLLLQKASLPSLLGLPPLPGEVVPHVDQMSLHRSGEHSLGTKQSIYLSLTKSTRWTLIKQIHRILPPLHFQNPPINLIALNWLPRPLTPYSFPKVCLLLAFRWSWDPSPPSAVSLLISLPWSWGPSPPSTAPQTASLACPSPRT